MTRINAFRNTRTFITWGKPAKTWGKNTGAVVFAAVLIACSVTVGCSSDKPKPVTSNGPIVVPQTPTASESMPAPAIQAANKPAPKKIVHKKPATVNYSDKTYGVAFEYPRRYAIETGDAAKDLVASSPLPMNFVTAGGVALAAVELPETSFANTDFSSAFFNVSVHKGLTADQCNEFAVPAPKSSSVTTTVEQTKVEAAPVQTAPVVATADTTKPAASDTTAAAAPATPSTTATSVSVLSATAQAEPQGSKLLIGDMELRATEAVSGEGTRQSDSKYFHVFQNGACYEFGLNVTTVASEQGVTKHVDRDKVFGRLETILSTVKINPVAAPEVAAEAPAAPVAETPAQ